MYDNKLSGFVNNFQTAQPHVENGWLMSLRKELPSCRDTLVVTMVVATKIQQLAHHPSN